MEHQRNDGVRAEPDPTTDEFHVWDCDQLVLTLTHEEACCVARDLPRMRRSDALTMVAGLLTKRGVRGQTGQVMLLIDDLVKMIV